MKSQTVGRLSPENPVFENELDNRPNNEIVAIRFAYKSLGLGWSSRKPSGQRVGKTINSRLGRRSER